MHQGDGESPFFKYLVNLKDMDDFKYGCFCIVAEKIEFPAEEEKVLAYWKEIDAFHE